MKYEPHPIDTSNVELSEKLHELIELLAKNIHDNWAYKRFDEGWSYGPLRNDSKREHPCLVEYHRLPESEKEYDRQTAIETLKTILALDYKIIEPVQQGSSIYASYEGSDFDEVSRIQSLVIQPSIKLNILYTIWSYRNPDLWNSNSILYQYLGERFVNFGEPLIAYDVLSEGMKHVNKNIRMRQLLALCLARSGATKRANAMLLKIYNEGHSDEETIGLLARTFKDLWLQATDHELKKDYLRKAFEHYSLAYRRTGGYWTGINAATTAFLLGEREQALTIASEVEKYCINQIKQTNKTDSDFFWLFATLGEAALICEHVSAAQEWYGKAVEYGSGKYGDLMSTRKNAKLILEYLHADCCWLEKYFRIPCVVVFSGHMIDKPDRTSPRFPFSIEKKIYRKIVKRLKELHAGFGYASAACGSDILFLEAIIELGGEAHVVLPYEKEQFVQDSVDIIPGYNWRKRFEKVLDRAVQVSVASDDKLNEGSIYFDYANLLLFGLAKNRSETLETDLVPMAVWDGNQGEGYGGTASVIEKWREHGLTAEVIDPIEILMKENPALRKMPSMHSNQIQSEKNETSEKFPQKIMAILFADVVKFSKLDEKGVSLFVKYFLGAISDLITRSPYKPEIKNTWGDALYFVFPNVRNAGLFALDICDLVENTNWAEKGLPEYFSIRIALHAGPVVSCIDPVLGAPTYTGTHVSHTARIEPVTPPGQVYASQAFAAIASAENITEFTCEYVGQTSMVKEYGTYPTYWIRRKNQREDCL